ncbi:hypothetical protein QX201_002629 [Fusarium graminearum]
MSASSETTTPSRFACLFVGSGADPMSAPEACRTGEPDWKHFRDHMKRKHVCKCRNICKTPMHFSANHIKRILKLRKKAGDPYHVLWTKMHRLAHPDAIHTPAPYLPTFSQALAVARDPSEDFAKMLVLNFANHGNTTQEEATRNALTFLKYLPVFHDTLSRTGSRPINHTVAQTANVDNHPSTFAFAADKGPLQLPPTPAADPVPAYESMSDQEGLIINEWKDAEMAHGEQDHMSFLEKEFNGYF